MLSIHHFFVTLYCIPFAVDYALLSSGVQHNALAVCWLTKVDKSVHCFVRAMCRSCTSPAISLSGAACNASVVKLLHAYNDAALLA